MKSLINMYLCATLYMQVVSFSKLNPLLMFKFYRKGLKKHGYLKDEGGSMRFTRRYNHMMRNLLASLHFYAKTAYISVGLLPLWFFLGKKIVGNYFIGLLCSFVIPYFIVERFVFKKDAWLRYWRQIESMPSRKRRKLLIWTCVVKVCFWILFATLFVVLMPILK